ncbi:SDR family NAD(P)-dependent oxidoreductase [Cupriavidus consociatus]|uniref:SDR family NAD(P)-dependent oxidoreductase n=1 Tax=Cupriavidus consociatus TaxID=2821357 RepID=UPI001AE2335D|nr:MULTISPECIES: SDR family NAD(P)-dependent oxidoreductase [unclassified Cupriavidus]MBP0621159.1 SDR family NAD(P)-dependent oxidoreductase [Cupriavidus sp. LEh25]MDK2657829.1 SDR family NAD(P)-dependent oxidoreductase [Cupriavidus sp. LEh21]
MKLPAAVVVGVGTQEGLGAALCRKFADEKRHVFVAGRTQEKLNQVVAGIRAIGGSAESLQMDATREEDVVYLLSKAFGPSDDYVAPDLVVFNAGNSQRIDFRELTAEQFEDFWRVGCFAGFLVGRETARLMAPLGRGTLIFTGASASLRGRPGYAHFSAAKAGLRMLSQSMAREFGPHGLHVAHVTIDGRIDSEGRPAPALASTDTDALLSTDAIAHAYWQLHEQHKSAWTQELDLRPFRDAF